MKNDFMPAVGHRFNFAATGAACWTARCSSIEPNKKLSYTWNCARRRGLI